jgi:hypothetical protein
MQEKDKLKSLASKERVHKPVETQNTRNYEKLRNNSVDVTKLHSRGNGSTSEKLDKGITKGNKTQVAQVINFSSACPI